MCKMKKTIGENLWSDFRLELGVRFKLTMWNTSLPWTCFRSLSHPSQMELRVRFELT